jgi:hypothetical protein
MRVVLQGAECLESAAMMASVTAAARNKIA